MHSMATVQYSTAKHSTAPVTPGRPTSGQDVQQCDPLRMRTWVARLQAALAKFCSAAFTRKSTFWRVKMSTSDFYLRYYVGHKGKFGHEFLEFEFRPDGRFSLAVKQMG